MAHFFTLEITTGRIQGRGQALPLLQLRLEQSTSKFIWLYTFQNSKDFSRKKLLRNVDKMLAEEHKEC
uniref:Uncharacterized protein n=1 Tax=Salix viminalis TaxID=40686 RepID=A0A6N2NK39_SALVM